MVYTSHQCKKFPSTRVSSHSLKLDLEYNEDRNNEVTRVYITVTPSMLIKIFKGRVSWLKLKIILFYFTNHKELGKYFFKYAEQQRKT